MLPPHGVWVTEATSLTARSLLMVSPSCGIALMEKPDYYVAT